MGFHLSLNNPPPPLLPPDTPLYILPITFPYFIPGLLWESEKLACFFCCTFKRFQDMKNLYNKVILLHIISKLFITTIPTLPHFSHMELGGPVESEYSPCPVSIDMYKFFPCHVSMNINQFFSCPVSIDINKYVWIFLQHQICKSG